MDSFVSILISKNIIKGKKTVFVDQFAYPSLDNTLRAFVFVVVETMASNSLSRTSGWMFKDLGQLNISYGEHPMDLKEFMDLLKVRIDQPELNNINVPEKHQSLLNYTRAYWKLSFDFDIRRSGGKRKTEQFMGEQKRKITEGIEEANAFMDKLRNDELPVFSKLKTSNDFER